MDPDAYGLLLLCATGFLIALLGNVVPFSSVEIYLLGVAAIAPPIAFVPLVLFATAGDMSGKTALYLGGRRIERAVPGRRGRVIERLRTTFAQRGRTQGLTLLASAVAGLPPFYLITILCGAVRVPLVRYVVIGTAGRLVRFGALVMAPDLATRIV